MEYLDLASDVVARALRRGADDAECVVREGSEFSVTVRMGEVEQLKESGSKAIGLRVLRGRRAASAYSSDFSSSGLETLIGSALESAGFTSEDPHAGLPDSEELGVGADAETLALYDDDILELSSEEKIGRAKLAESTALDADPRVTNSEGAGFGAGWGRWSLANSRGFAGEYRAGNCSLSMVAVAESNGEKERASWYTLGRGVKDLDSPAEVGRIAAERAARRLGAVKVSTTEVPVVFEPPAARSLLGHIVSALNGDTVYRQASFLAGQIGKQIAHAGITVVDDGLLPARMGTSPFDDEGVASRRTTLIRDGVLESYLLNCYTARKLGLKTTGNASRGLAGNPGVGSGNVLLEEGGARAAADIIGSVRNGFFVTELMGFGVNLVTGDYSRGASGFWIENGEITYPVSGVTIAGNLKQMLLAMEMIGDDPDFRGSIAAPTILIGRMTVAGK